jgi:hypothetical protein
MFSGLGRFISGYFVGIPYFQMVPVADDRVECKKTAEYWADDFAIDEYFEKNGRLL